MLKEIQVDALQVRISENRALMGSDAAKLAGEKLKKLLSEKDFLSIVFAAAPSQNEFLAALAKEKDINWKRVRAFHMDEYIGLRDDAPQTFGNFLKALFFHRVPLLEVHYLNGRAKDIPAECRRYADLLIKYPTDVVFMGIGENTHIAFNDPHVADFNDPEQVKVVDLDQTSRQQQVNDGCFKSLEDVPKHALTLTIPALLKAAYIYCMVPGKTKAQAVYHTLNSSITETYPSTILRTHTNTILFIDKDSSALLQS